MSSERNLVQQSITQLKQKRDELALKIHLGAADAKDEFEKAKQKLEVMSDEFEPVKDAVEESAGNVFSALKLVGEEVRGSFDRIYQSLK